MGDQRGNGKSQLIRTQGANIPKAMQWTGVTWTRRFNNRHSKIGELFYVISSSISRIVGAMNLNFKKIIS